ncbi:uncharacterized protein LOC141588031 [Silene latifolia]|uniref:uncharacterized protein LOC141588031 n=1 Tax=Silene latifolia TaxID=37657 RepID=UPI003D76C26A
MIAWIYHHNALNLNEKLYKLGISEVDTCYIWDDNVETREHLFFDCPYSSKVLEEVKKWSRIYFPNRDLKQWRLSRKDSPMKKGVTNAILNVAIYHIWRQRNLSRFENKLLRPESVMNNIKYELRSRLAGDMSKITNVDRGWLDGLSV